MKKNEVYKILNEAYFSEEKHEKEIIDDLPSLLEGTKIFVDIGASLGQYAFFANKHIQKGQIFSIEPDPIRFEELERNCRKWESLNNNKVIALKAAVSDEDGEVTFFTTHSNTSGGLFSHNVAADVTWSEITVDSLRLDTLFKNQSPDFIKMDVEGVELRALTGATNILKKGKARFLIELHGFVDPKGQKNKNEVYKFMQSFGYYPVKTYEKIRVLFVKSRPNWFKAKLKSFCLNRTSCY